MPVKMSGAEYQRFLAADWGPNPMWEDYILHVDGEEVPEDADEQALIKEGSEVVISGGYIIPNQDEPHHGLIDAEKFARKWLKAQTTTVLTLEVSKDAVDAVVAMLCVRFPKDVRVLK